MQAQDQKEVTEDVPTVSEETGAEKVDAEMKNEEVEAPKKKWPKKEKKEKKPAKVIVLDSEDDEPEEEEEVPLTQA